VVVWTNMTPAGRPPRVENMTGLDRDQVDGLVEQLTASGLWQMHRRRALDPHRSVLVVLLYLRHNLSQYLLAELFGCSQPTISRQITLLTPILAQVLEPLAGRVAERELHSTRAIRCRSGYRRADPRPARRCCTRVPVRRSGAPLLLGYRRTAAPVAR